MILNNIENTLAILVLYKIKLQESITYLSLKESLKINNLKLDLLVYDNSPNSALTEKDLKQDNLNITYIHDKTNPGICKAYNIGVKFAKNNGKKWLLLLDQDSNLPINYFDEFLYLDTKLDVVCIIPKIVSPEGLLISPAKMYLGGLVRPKKNILSGVINEPVTGINSCTFLKLNFIYSIGGFNKEFPLDMLDHWYFREINKQKKNIYLMNVNIIHTLSVSSFEKEVSLVRYESILKSEKLFNKENTLDYLIYKLRLLVRIVKQLCYKDKRYIKMTLFDFFS